MAGSIQIDYKIDKLGKKSKRIVDLIFIVSLFVYISVSACKLVLSTPVDTELLYIISVDFLSSVAVFKVFIEYFKSRKRATLIFAYLVFCLLLFIFSGNNLALDAAVIAVAGFGVKADHILATGIAGNLVMIINNTFMSFARNKGIYIVDNQDRKFIGLGENTFYVSKMNNFSSTDFAAHYFWIFAAYLWIRGRKISWGEVAALGSLALLIYSLTASKTTLFCVFLLLFITVVMKIWYLLKDKKPDGDVQAESNGVPVIFSKIIAYCFKYSFLFFALAAILLSVLYSNSSTFFLNLNNKLHWRLSLGHRGIAEYGIHWISFGMPIYGMSSSVDGFYNFLDSSYINLLISKGILTLAFYLFSMTFIQIKHKKYVYGAAVLAVCALSCFEEHHLSEIPYNMFILLMFSDINPDYKVKNVVTAKKSLRTAITVLSWLMCLVFLVSFGVIYYLKYRAIKELDRLDVKAGEIYSAVQSNLDLMISDGTWEAYTSSMDSNQYGEMLKAPDDFMSVTKVSWNEVIKDPKEHVFYSVSYDSGYTGADEKAIVHILISDEVKTLIGNGSVVIEYDVVKGKVYSVWYSETPGCYVIPNGRRTDRAGRLRTDIKSVEGYSTGTVNG